ncbi:50S ribosomal protein L20 [Patescibacteria group bacterium]|nr:50S ribosomal protein L20 [Patescibacteria group bacterium]
MSRVKGGPRARKVHKKVILASKGYRMSRSKLFSRAQQAVIRAGEHAFHGRKEKKRDFRRIWIQRITAGLTGFDINYSRFIKALSDKKIELNRKTLSQMAVMDPEGFGKVVDTSTKK